MNFLKENMLKTLSTIVAAPILPWLRVCTSLYEDALDLTGKAAAKYHTIHELNFRFGCYGDADGGEAGLMMPFQLLAAIQ